MARRKNTTPAQIINYLRKAELESANGSCIRLRPLSRHHVWSYDFVADRTMTAGLWRC